MNRTQVQLGIAIALAAIGLGVVGASIYNLTIGENVAATNQQKLAEVEPLVRTVELGGSELSVGEVFAKIRVPRFGKDYVRNIAEGTSLSKVLNTVGIGHYLGTQFPGEVGNFAIAGHRAGNGGPMRDIDKFQPGDEVIVETAVANFTYRYLESWIVPPETLGVLSPVPKGLSSAKPGGSYLTLTSCTPIYVNTERFVAWFELVN